MKPSKELTDEKRAATVAAKISHSTPVTEFMDRVTAILDKYDKRDKELVTGRKIKH